MHNTCVRADAAVADWQVGGVRRLYIPGELAFPKPLRAAAGRWAGVGYTVSQPTKHISSSGQAGHAGTLTA